MERRKFVKSSLLTIPVMSAGFTAAAAADKTKSKEFYELRAYELKEPAGQEKLDSYFQQALIPALNKLGVKNVGVFRELGKTDSLKTWLLIPYSSMDAYLSVSQKLKKDEAFKKSSESYNSLPKAQAVYNRFTTSFLEAFDGMPAIIVPAKTARIFELRTYEGFSEDAVTRKIKMFNKEEFPVFYQTGLIPVFFGEVIAGDHMPCLTYMLTFPDQATKEKNWKTFIDSPEWKKVSGLPEYADTVSKVISVLLEPLPYSQV